MNNEQAAATDIRLLPGREISQAALCACAVKRDVESVGAIGIRRKQFDRATCSPAAVGKRASISRWCIGCSQSCYVVHFPTLVRFFFYDTFVDICVICSGSAQWNVFLFPEVEGWLRSCSSLYCVRSVTCLDRLGLRIFRRPCSFLSGAYSFTAAYSVHEAAYEAGVVTK